MFDQLVKPHSQNDLNSGFPPLPFLPFNVKFKASYACYLGEWDLQG